MNGSLALVDFFALSPLLILLFGALVILLVESFAPHLTKKYAVPLTLATLFLAMYAQIQAPVSENPLLTPWLRFDTLATTFSLLFLSIGVAATLLSAAFFTRFAASEGEYFFLLLAALFGLLLIGFSADFLILFLGIETLSISLYILVGYMKEWKLSSEGAIKYFLMGSLAAAFLLYGIALIYGAIGTTRFDALLSGYQGITTSGQTALFLGGIAFVTLALCFEAALVPFQLWAPDVYAGATTPVTAFMAVGTKVGAFAALIRIFVDALPHFNPLWNESVSVLIYFTLLYANYVALLQTNLRRFFAYSGISHAGFLMIPLVAGTGDSLAALLFYLVVYVVATLGAFAALAVLDRENEGVTLDNLRGLYSRAPVLTLTLSLCLLTLAGIPPTVGFFAKFYILKVAFSAGYIGLVVVGLLTTILSAYYYLRIVGIMLSGTPEISAKPKGSLAAGLVGTAALLSIIALSCYPDLLVIAK